VVLLLFSIATADTRPDAPPGDAYAVLAALDAAAAGVTSLRYGVVRTSTENAVESEERWRFATHDGRFRVDYSGDTQRVMICDGALLVDYVPVLREAMQYDLHRMDAAEAQAVIGRVLDKVAVPGFRTGADPSWTWAWSPEPQQVGESWGWRAVGTDGFGGELSFVVSDDGQRLYASSIRQHDEFVVSVEARDHLEIAAGVWFPQTVAMQAPGEGGLVDVELRVQGLRAEAVPDSTFDTTLDPSIELSRVP